MDARRRLFRAAEDLGQLLAARRMQRVDKIAAIVNEELRMRVERLVDEIEIFLVRAVMPCEDLDAVFDERRRDIVLRRKRIAARDGNLRACMRKDLGHIGRLRLKMQRDRHADALERFRLRELLVHRVHDRHEVLDPFDLVMARRSKLNITNHGFHQKIPP